MRWCPIPNCGFQWIKGVPILAKIILGLFSSFLAWYLVVTMLKICIFDFFIDKLASIYSTGMTLSWGTCIMTKFCQFSEHNTHSYFNFLCIDDVSFSSIVHIENVLLEDVWRNCPWEVISSLLFTMLWWLSRYVLIECFWLVVYLEILL